MATTVQPGSPVLGDIDKLVWRDTNRPRPIWAFGLNLAGSTLVLRVSWWGGGFATSSDPDDPNVTLYGGLDLIRLSDIDPDAAVPADAAGDPLYRDTVCWSFSPAAAALIPLGRIAAYRLRREMRDLDVDEVGEMRLYREGFLIGRSA
ncbi:hypothetical protein HNR00_003595 [Methylorubrum rhodinum]|uniref:Uncharacterized protein n=1 Tax=Methylorubrum rhodinum TaxID=29428 RepID=A0A840ZP95_9HYPH|nr:hypothetical protein [Methylorubrum rhodinum]MBB5758868.1 hypothetical protein [Methylorubrum rhodinum]